MGLRLKLAKAEVKYPVKKQGNGGDVGIPLSLLYLGAYARENSDTDIEIVDYRLNKALGKERDFDADFGEVDVVGVGACTSESPDATNILRHAKTMGKTTIMGGLYATFNSERVLNEGSTDFVVRGEGDVSLSNLLNALDRKIPLEKVRGISYKKDGKIIHNPDADLIENLDDLLMPAYDLIDPSAYLQFGPAPIYSARGCPMTCDFCTLNEMWGFRHRSRSVEKVIQELELLRGFGFERVHFKDETVTLYRKNAMNFFRELGRANLGLSYKVKSRINQFDSELLKVMIGAGVDTIHTGVETIVQRNLDLMKKGVSEESIRNAFRLTQEYGCNLNPVYLFGSAGETPEELKINSDFAREMGQQNGVVTYISFMTPHPGTSLEGNPDFDILSTDYSRYTHKQPVAVPKSLGRDGLNIMVDAYHSVARDTKMEDVNPKIDSRYLREISQKSRREVLVA